MKSVLLVHGSPGAASELSPLREALLARDVKAEALRMPETDASPVYAPIVEAARNVDAVVAYSFGCYFTLRAVQEGGLNNPLCLVNPHLVGKEGVSPVAGFLLGVPGVGRALIGKGLDKRVEDFLVRTFEPAAAPDVLRKELHDPALWIRAARWKQLLMASPLRPIDATSMPPLRIVIGTADSSSPWSHHTGAFSSLPGDAQVTRVEGAGHALPFTHADRVADAVLELLAHARTSPKP